MSQVRALFAVLVLTFCAEARAREGDVLPARKDGVPVMVDDAVGFGRLHQWAFSSDASISISRTTLSGTKGAQVTVSFAPAADYFVLENLSLGGAIGLTYNKSGESNGVRFTIGPRVGYNFKVSRLLSIWPRLGLAYAYTSSDQVVQNFAGQELQTAKGNAISINIFAPVMVHPAPHFFAGLGPFVEADLNGDRRATSWGVKLTMGGWLQQREDARKTDDAR
jgi:hypothetical protein